MNKLSEDIAGAFPFFSGGGLMGSMIRNKEWSTTPLGKIETWPNSIKLSVRMCLESPYPVLLGLGPDLRLVYNNSLMELLGTSIPPAALGTPLSELLSDNLNFIQQVMEKVFRTGETLSKKEQCQLLNRNGYTEESYWNYSCTPIRLDQGEIAGVYAVFEEITENVLFRQELNTLKNLNSALHDCKTKEEVIRETINSLLQNGHDFSFISFYNEAGGSENISFFAEIDGSNGNEDWKSPLEKLPEFLSKIEECKKTFQLQIIEEVDKKVLNIPRGYWNTVSTNLLILPLTPVTNNSNIYFLIAGINPYKKIEKEYRDYLQLIAGQIASSLSRTEQSLNYKVDPEVQYRKAFLEAQNEAIPDALLIVDTKGNILSYNKHFAEIWRIPQEILDAKNDSAALSYAMTQVIDPQAFINEVNYYYKNSHEASHEEIYFKDGRILERFGNAVLGDDGVYYGWIWYFRDITERKNAEELLRASEDRYQNFISQSTEGIWRFELEKLIPFGLEVEEQLALFSRYAYLAECNNAMARMYGYDDASEMIGMRLNQLFPDDEDTKAYLTHFIESGYRVESAESKEVDKNGNTVYFINNLVGIIENGNLVRAWGTQRNITDQKVGDEKLRESESRFRNIANDAPAFIFMAGPNAEVEFVSQSWMQFTGLSEEEAKGQGWAKVTHPDDLQMSYEIYNRGFETRKAYQYEMRQLATDGTYHWVLWKGIPRTLPNNDFLGILGIGIDITDRKNAEQALSYQKTLLESVTQNTDMALFLMDEKQFCVYMNEAAEKLTGYSLDELKGKQLHYHIHHSYPDGTPFPVEECPIDQALPKESRMKGEETFVHKDGSFYTVAFTASPIKIDGKAIGTVIEVRDTSEEKKKEQALRSSESRFRTLAETLPQLIWVRNMDGTIEFSSKSWEEYTGIKDMREAWKKMIYPDDWDPIMNMWQNALDSGNPFKYEIRLKNKHGQYRWHYAVGEPVKDENGNVVKYIGALTDIHEQKTFSERLEEQVVMRTSELQNAQSFLQQLIDSSVEFIMVIDKNLDIITVNKRFEQALRLGRDQLKGKNLFDINPMAKNTEQHDSILKALKGETVHLEKRQAIYRPEIYLDTYYFPLLVHEKTEGVIVMARDVSAIVKTEKMLEQINVELQRSNEDLQQFAHVASHDLKEPVRKILTFGNRLKQEFGSELPEKAIGYLSKVESSAIRMYSMIDGVLLYSSLNALDQTKENIELKEMLQNIESDLELLITQKEATIETGEMPLIEGSNILMYQLFYNLMNNSLKFSSPDRKPIIRIFSSSVSENEIEFNNLNRQREYVKITLLDNGIGFTDEQAKKIFGSFTRLHSKDKYEGTGLGLSLCKKIVERHGGVINASGKEGEEARFEIILPVS